MAAPAIRREHDRINQDRR